MAKYVWYKTKFKGLRYREHPTRNSGFKDVKGKNIKDRFYQYRVMIDGKMVQESLGWWSKWVQANTESRRKRDFEIHCVQVMERLKEARRTGKGPATLKEVRQQAESNRRQKERQSLTFKDVWEKHYLPQAKADRGEKSLTREESVYNLWIKPVIDDKAMVEVAAIHLEKIKSNMRKEEKAARTIQYALAIVRQVFNYAKRQDLFNGDNPVNKVVIPSAKDNERIRFLTRAEADALLKQIKKISPDTHDQALLSLHTGMRAGEIFSLTWGAVDFANGVLALKNTKNGRTRAAYLTEEAKKMLQVRQPESPEPDQLVFPNRNGDKIVQVSNSFGRAVDKLKLNQGITDPRDKVVFHTLRHTFASWLVMAGTDLYVVKELLGHRDFKMTSRYAHLGQNPLQAAVRRFEKHMDKRINKQNKKIVDIKSAQNES